jgi:hypothetical protein
MRGLCAETLDDSRLFEVLARRHGLGRDDLVGLIRQLP